MTFLQGIFLYGLIAVTIPLIIHLLSKRKKVPVLFSSLYFLKLLENRKIRRLKIRQLLLLIFRMVLMALLVFAFSRPTLLRSSGEEYSNDENISAFLIIDNTLSTSAVYNGNSVYSMIKSMALEIISMLNSGDEIYVIFTGNGDELSELQAYYDPETVSRQIISSTFTFNSKALNKYISSAYEKILHSSNLNREIYVISDFHENSIDERPITQQGQNSKFPVKLFYAVAGPERMQNAAVANVSVHNQVFEQNKEIGIRAILVNHSGSLTEDVLASLYVEGKRIAQKNVDLPANSQEIVEFSFIPGRGGELSGIVEIEDDAVSADNKRFFTIDIPEILKVLIIHDEPEENEFIEAVFSADFNKLFDPVFIFPDRINSVDLKNFDLVIFNGFNTWSGSDVFRMKNYLTGGGGIIIFPGNRSDIDSYNRFVAGEFSLPLAEEISGRLQDQNDDEAAFVTVSQVDLKHPIFLKMFDSPDPAVDYPRIYKSMDMKTRDGTDVVMELTNGKPFLTIQTWENGRIALFSSRPSLTWNTLPVKGIYAPLMHRIAAYLSETDFTGQGDILIGENIEFYYNGSIIDLSILSPEGSEFRLTPEITAETFRITFSETINPGIYICSAGSADFRKFAVNVDPAEADLDKLVDDKLVNIAGENPSYFIRHDTDISETIIESRSGREIGDYFLIVILILIAIEFIIQFEKPDKAFEEREEEQINT